MAVLSAMRSLVSETSLHSEWTAYILAAVRLTASLLELPHLRGLAPDLF